MAFSLSSFFDEIQSNWDAIEKWEGSSNDQQHQTKVIVCLNQVKEAANQIEKNGVFSYNEELEDIATKDLR